MFRGLLYPRAQASAARPDIADIQDDIGEWDPLFDFEHHSVAASFTGAAVTNSKIDALPPFPIEEPEVLPARTEGAVVIDIYYPHTRPGTGPDDLEPMIPEGLDGF